MREYRAIILRMTPQPDYHDWPTKAEVVQALGAGFSSRSVEYLIEQGKIRVAHRPVPHRRAATVCNPADVEQAVRERRAAVLSPVTTAIAALQTPVLAGIVGESAGLPVPEAPFGYEASGVLSSKAVALTDKLFLSIEEAVEYSGLPASYLYKMIRQGELTTVRADRWVRIRRSSLDTL